MGVLAPIVHILGAPMLSCRHRLPVSHLVAAESVGDRYSRPITLVFQNFREERSRSLTVPRGLDQDVEHVSMSVDRAPQIFSGSTDVDEQFVEVPLVASRWLMSAQPAGVFGPETGVPGADCLVGDVDTGGRPSAVRSRGTRGETGGRGHTQCEMISGGSRNPLYIGTW